MAGTGWIHVSFDHFTFWVWSERCPENVVPMFLDMQGNQAGKISTNQYRTIAFYLSVLIRAKGKMVKLT